MKSPLDKALLTGITAALILLFAINILFATGVMNSDVFSYIILPSLLGGALIGLIIYNRARIRELENKIASLDHRIDRLTEQK